MSPKHLHIIGICGVATSAIAIAFKKAGWKVTGSDKGFYPPVSTELENNQVSFYAGWHPENVGKPDIIMTGGGGTSPNNPEVLYAAEHKIPVFAYPEILEKYFIKKNSIVTVGTWGKTTSSSLLSYILIKAAMNPSYFTGGLSLSHDTGAISDSDWSVVEGDEYQVSISDKRPKFVYYHPTHLLLTSVSWDHADLYPTEQAYFDEFNKLISNVPSSGLIVACVDNDGVRKVLATAASGKPVVTYGVAATADYRYHSVVPTTQGLDLVIDYKGEHWQIHSPMLGRFNAENITGCFALAHTIGVKPEKIMEVIADFKGIKRRFEKRLEGDITVMDCHAPTAEKAASVLANIREVYHAKIIVVYEPNIGGRQRSSSRMYDGAFKDADTVIIPRLTKLKVADDGSETPLEGDELAATIKKTYAEVQYIEDDATLVASLKQQAQKGDIIVFMGSHGFRGMIEETVKVLQ